MYLTPSLFSITYFKSWTRQILMVQNILIKNRNPSANLTITLHLCAHFQLFNYKGLAWEPYAEEKSKIAAVPTACSFGGNVFSGWWIDCASKRKCCLHSSNFRFFRHVVKTHLSSGHESLGTIDTLEVCFYRKPSLILLTFIKI